MEQMLRDRAGWIDPKFGREAQVIGDDSSKRGSWIDPKFGREAQVRNSTGLARKSWIDPKFGREAQEIIASFGWETQLDSPQIWQGCTTVVVDKIQATVMFPADGFFASSAPC